MKPAVIHDSNHHQGVDGTGKHRTGDFFHKTIKVCSYELVHASYHIVRHKCLNNMLPT